MEIEAFAVPAHDTKSIVQVFVGESVHETLQEVIRINFYGSKFHGAGHGGLTVGDII